MKWTNLVHVLIDKIETLIQTVSKLVLLVQVLVQHLERMPDSGSLSFGGTVKYDDPETEVADGSAAPEKERSKRRVIHIRDLVLAEGDYLMDTVEACDVLGISRVTLVVRREEGLLTKVEIGKKGGGVRYIASEVMEMQQWYSVPKGKV